MGLRKNLYLCLILALLMPANGAANPAAAKVLDIRIHPQHTLEWCWAASTAAVVEYVIGQPMVDCQLLSAYDYMLGGRGRCCEGNPECVRAGYPGEIKELLSMFDIPAHHQSTPITYDRLIQEIDSRRPVIIALWMSAPTAHIVVITGYEKPDTVIIMNPTSDRLLRVQYTDLITNWKWKDTILIGNASGR